MRHRHRRQESLIEVLITLPWWISLIFAGLAFLACYFAPSILQFESPAFAAFNELIEKLPGIAPYVTIPFLITAGISAFSSHRDHADY